MRDTTGEFTDLASAVVRFAFHNAAKLPTKLPVYAPATGSADDSPMLFTNEIDCLDSGGLHR